MEKKSKNSKKHVTYITKDMTMGEIVNRYPEVVPKLMDYGIHCIGCHVSPYETLEQGLAVHGFDEKTTNKIFNEINRIVEKNIEKKKKLKIKIDKGIELTEVAASKIKQVLEEKKSENVFLRLRVYTGPTYSYWMGLDNQKTEFDLELESRGIKIVVDKQDYQFLDGTKIDFVTEKNIQGFKFFNPNEPTPSNE
ncbi:MAG: iron-sulfur cluster assembly accessory protein [Candidatus Micrarchaeota archaeon]|nr:iron-sulfur cluster assembly accessory protein [Candidatus Micrarchaeota archaeon]